MKDNALTVAQQANYGLPPPSETRISLPPWKFSSLVTVVLRWISARLRCLVVERSQMEREWSSSVWKMRWSNATLPTSTFHNITINTETNLASIIRCKCQLSNEQQRAALTLSILFVPSAITSIGEQGNAPIIPYEMIAWVVRQDSKHN